MSCRVQAPRLRSTPNCRISRSCAATPREPKGVLQKNLKILLYLGAALLVILAAVFSSVGRKGANGKAAPAKDAPPQPMVQDNTDNNVQDLKNQLAAERLKEQQQAANASNADPALAMATPAQQAAAAAYSPTGQTMPCVPGQPCPQVSYGQQMPAQPQLTPAQQQAQQLAAKERELAYNSRFASNLAYVHQENPPAQSRDTEGALAGGADPPASQNSATSSSAAPSNLVAPRAAGERQSQAADSPSAKHNPEVNIDSAVGQPYVIYEGLTMDTVLMNRLDGDAVGPVKVLVSNPVYSHDRQHVLIPDGTIVLGEARKIGSVGFGQQRRLAVVFHRMIMPDGYSVDLDQFHGLDQIGEEGLKDKVNNHYLEIFGTSIALGRDCRRGADYSGRRRLRRLRIPGLHQWRSFVRFPICDHHHGPLHADPSQHHDSRGTSRKGLLHAGHALACV